MQHDVYLRTIPHTGTRFVSAILDYLGVRHQQWHFGWPKPHEYVQFDDQRVPIDVVPRTPETRYVVTARNPYDTWESLEHDGRGWAGLCREWYQELEAFCDANEHVLVFKLDQPISELAEFCGVDYDGGFTWNDTSKSGCPHGTCPDEVRDQLHGAHQWYSRHL